MASPVSFSVQSFVFSSTLFLWLFLQPTLTQAGGAGGEKLIFEDGYLVSTVFDGDKSNIRVNPHSIFPQSPSSDDRFILLDSVSSTFYTLSLPTASNETGLQKLVGNGESNYMDGDLGSARFNKPRSFAVDYKGNVYVADHRNHAIRMITKSGVTTIAGGRSQRPGRIDGPAPDASFSDDFELTFVPGRCALMISDHGNRLIRQINLKEENCKVPSGSVLGTTSAWILGLAVSCIIGLIIGLVIRPYIIPYEGQKPLQFNGTWKHYLTSLERQIVMFCSGIRNAVVKSKAYLLSYRLVILSLSHLSLMFKLRNVELITNPKQSMSLLDCDIVDSDNILTPPKVYDDLNGLMIFDGGSILLETSKNVVEEEKEKENASVSRDGLSNVDSMIQANLIDFEEQSARVCSTESLECSSGLIKRRRGVVAFPSST